MIIANTVKGKGVSFMENNNLWHYKNPNLDELNKSLIEIKKKYSVFFIKQLVNSIKIRIIIY